MLPKRRSLSTQSSVSSQFQAPLPAEEIIKDSDQQVNRTVEFLKNVLHRIAAFQSEDEDDFETESRYFQDDSSCTHSRMYMEQYGDPQSATIQAGDIAGKQKKKKKGPCEHTLECLQRAIEKEIHTLKASQRDESPKDTMLHTQLSDKDITFNQKTMLNNFEIQQNGSARRFFDEEPVFAQVFQTQYGTVQKTAQQWIPVQEEWLSLMRNIHFYFFRQLKGGLLCFHFFRTFEFFIAQLVRSYRHNDITQNLRKWLVVLPDNLLVFLAKYGYELIRKYHRIFMGYDLNDVQYNGKNIARKLLNKDDTKLNADKISFGGFLRTLLLAIQAKHDKQIKNRLRFKTQLANAKLQDLVHWCNPGEAPNYILPFQGDTGLEAYAALERTFYDKNKKQTFGFFAQIDALHQEYAIVSQCEQKQLTDPSAQQAEVDSREALREYCNKLQNLLNSPIGQAEALFPLRKIAPRPPILGSYMVATVIDLIVNAVIGDSEKELTCIGGVVIEKGKQFSAQDWNLLQLKLYYLPQTPTQSVSSSTKDVASSVNQKRKADSSLAENSEEKAEEDFQTKKRPVEVNNKMGVVSVSRTSNQDQGARERKVLDFILKKKVDDRKALCHSYQLYNNLLEKVYSFLSEDFNFIHLLYQYSPDGMMYASIILPKLIKDYLLSEKTILFEYCLIRDACKALRFWTHNEVAQFTAKQSVLYLRMANFIEQDAFFFDCETYQLNMQEQSAHYESAKRLQMQFQLSTDDITIFKSYNLIHKDSDIYLDFSLLTQFKNYIKGDSDAQKALHDCLCEIGHIHAIFQSELDKYKGFRKRLTQISYYEKKMNQMSQLGSPALHTKTRNLCEKIGWLTTQLEYMYGSRPLTKPYGELKVTIESPTKKGFIADIVFAGCKDDCKEASTNSDTISKSTSGVYCRQLSVAERLFQSNPQPRMHLEDDCLIYPSVFLKDRYFKRFLSAKQKTYVCGQSGQFDGAVCFVLPKSANPRTHTAYRKDLKARVTNFEAEWAKRHLEDKKDVPPEKATKELEVGTASNAVLAPTTNQSKP